MYRIVIAVLLAAVLLTACNRKSKDELLAEGLRQLESGNPGGAIVLFKNALEEDQSFLEARYQLARAYVQAGKYDQAEREYQKVLRQAPTRTGIYLDMARMHIREGKADKALESAAEYLAKSPESAEAFEIKGTAYVMKGQYAEAERWVRNALRLEPAETKARLQLAAICLATGREGEARAVLDEITAKDPKNTRALYMLADLELRKGGRQAALDIFRKIATIDPKDAQALYRSGKIHLDAGEFEKAQQLATELRQKHPKRGEGSRLQGIIHFHRKNFQEAVTAFQDSVKLQPSVEGYYFLGLSLYSRGELENALSQFRKILDHDPELTRARLMTAMILLNQKRLDDAVAEVKKVLDKEPANALARNVLGSAYLAKGMYDEGMKELNRATEIDPRIVDAHLKKGIFHLSKGMEQAAETDLATAVKVAPELLNSRIILASYYLRRNNSPRALATLKGGLRGVKEDAVLYNIMAGINLSGGNASEGTRCLQKAKETDPGFFAPYFNMATFYAVQGNYDQALGEYGAVLKRDARNIQAMLGTAALMEIKGRDADALAWYTRAKETGAPSAFLALAGHHIKKKEGVKAVAALDEGIKASPRNVDLLVAKGRLCISEKKYKDGLRVFDDLEAVSPDGGLTEKIAAYVTMGEHTKALEQARRMVTLKPNSARGYLAMAVVHESRNELDPAIEQVKSAVRVEGDNLPARIKLGDLYARKKDYTAALRIYEETAARNPDYAPAHFAQGALLELTGKKKEAIGKYRQAVTKDEHYVPALNNLAYLYADGFGPKQEALRLALTAFKYQPGSPGIMDTYGYALLKNGRNAEALKVLAKASELLSGNPTVLYHLALAQRQSGNGSEATATLQKALNLGDFPEAAAARSLLSDQGRTAKK